MDSDKMNDAQRRAISEAARYMSTADGATTASHAEAVKSNPEHLKKFSAYLRILADECDALSDCLKKTVEGKKGKSTTKTG